jgi:hypothetical protein
LSIIQDAAGSISFIWGLLRNSRRFIVTHARHIRPRYRDLVRFHILNFLDLHADIHAKCDYDYEKDQCCKLRIPGYFIPLNMSFCFWMIIHFDNYV